MTAPVKQQTIMTPAWQKLLLWLATSVLTTVAIFNGCQRTPGALPPQESCLTTSDCSTGSCVKGTCIKNGGDAPKKDGGIEVPQGEQTLEVPTTDNTTDSSPDSPPDVTLPDAGDAGLVDQTRDTTPMDTGTDAPIDAGIGDETLERQKEQAREFSTQESIPESCKDGATLPCSTSGVGLCATGTITCNGGQWGTCVVYTPKRELCGDNLDNDCDGQVDEYCGPQYNYAVVASNGVFVKRFNGQDAQRGFKSVSQLKDKEYELEPSAQDCDKNPIFLTARGTRLRSTAYTCDKDNYIVRLGTQVQTNLRNQTVSSGAFSAVIPGPSESTARVRIGSCKGTRGKACKLEQKRGNITKVYWHKNGIYYVESSLCAKLWSPLFVSIYASDIKGYYTVQSGVRNKDCRIDLYGLTGGRIDVDFAVWLPDPTKATWVTISKDDGSNTNFTNQIKAANPLNDPNAPWGGQRKVTGNACPTGSRCHRTELTFPSWAFPSAVLVMPRELGMHGGTFNSDSSGQRAITYVLISGIVQQYTRNMTVLYAH